MGEDEDVRQSRVLHWCKEARNLSGNTRSDLLKIELTPRNLRREILSPLSPSLELTCIFPRLGNSRIPLHMFGENCVNQKEIGQQSAEMDRCVEVIYQLRTDHGLSEHQFECG